MGMHDALILGAGGAGLMTAITAGQRGRRVLVLDHAARPGGKIIISGGGRCNFTNRSVSAANFVCENPHFVRSALSRYPPERFIALLDRHRVAWHERKHGQLFLLGSAQQIIDVLVDECRAAGVELKMKHEILGVTRTEAGFVVRTDHGEFSAPALVVATGGLSYPKFHATGVGYDIARSFGLKIVTRAPALDGFVFEETERAQLSDLAGNATEAELSTGGITFRESLLFTHTGLSGPVALQSSLHWRAGEPVIVNFLPTLSREALLAWLAGQRGRRAELKNQLASLLPRRLAERLCELHLSERFDAANATKKEQSTFADALQAWSFVPRSTVGYHKAEVTRGGVDTAELSSKTMEARRAPGLYFVGEVVDVTGWLGGYNYQWAWASGSAAGEAL